MRTDFNSNYLMTIDGRLDFSSDVFDVFNPATEEVIARVPEAARTQLDAAVAAAKRAFPAWSARPIVERQTLVSKIGDVIEQHSEELKRLLTREQGKARAGAEWEIGGAIVWCREIAKQSLATEIVEKSDARTVKPTACHSGLWVPSLPGISRSSLPFGRLLPRWSREIRWCSNLRLILLFAR